MSARLPRVFTLAPGGTFLAELAEAVLAGFPVGDAARPLSEWTILLPTRRAARAFGEVLRQKKGATALILPRIKPIGDLDEDRLASESVAADLPPALSPVAQLFVLLDLVEQWLAENPRLPFAQEIAASPLQRLALAESLNELVQRVENQETGFDGLKAAYGAEQSEHREAILSLLSLLSQRLPEVHRQRHTMGAAARRSRMIRLEAERIANGGHKGPVIAAGSTGTIPATRALLEAIARHEQGAVVLPGLDLFADEESWQALPPEHPQFALKELLAAMELKRSDVQPLSKTPGRRERLSSELMRPSATAEQWHEKLPPLADHLSKELSGLSELAAPDALLEARAIALVLREVLSHEGETAALVTPDRDLATRVASELARYGIEIEDSAGTSLARLGLGSLLDLICSACRDGFSAASLMAILRHAEVRLGPDAAEAARDLRRLEITGLRGLPFDLAELSFSALVEAAHKAQARSLGVHPLVGALAAEDWSRLKALAARLDVIFVALRARTPGDFAAQLSRLEACLSALAPEADWARPVNAALQDLLLELREQAWPLASASLADAALLVQHLLRKTNGPPPTASHRRLSILGTLEARLIPADVMVLGGLNEGVWPAQADPGPWLNRSMRSHMGLPQPEREIGLAAHDFVQGLGHARVVMSWAARRGDAPASPSRWLLRLNTVLQAAGLQSPRQAGAAYVGWAKALHAPHAGLPLQGPVAKPRPRPPRALRPTTFSATAVERLVRNPYAIFARRILALEPLPDFGFAPDAALRGSLFHEAIGLWNEAQAPGLEALLAAGRAVFAPLQEQHEIRTFWWPQFLRMAGWLAEQEGELKQGLRHILAERSGRLEFSVAGIRHALTARADRIDVLAQGLRLIDYKTGGLPTPDQIESGLSPQLPLEAAIVIGGGYQDVSASAAEVEALYLRISASMNGLERKWPTNKTSSPLAVLAARHLEGFKALMAAYQDEAQAYLPRLRVFKEEDEADYDHLSRYLEWQLAGEA